MIAGPIPNPAPASSTTIELDGRTWHIQVEWGLMQNRVEPLRVSFTSCTTRDSGDLEPDGVPITQSRIRRLEISKALKLLRTTESRSEYIENNLLYERELLLGLEDHADHFHQDGGAAPDETYAAIEARHRRIAELEKLQAASTGPQRGRRLTSEVLREVADVYLRAKADPLQRVTAAVAMHFDISRSAASKRIMAARFDGYIKEKGKTK